MCLIIFIIRKKKKVSGSAKGAWQVVKLKQPLPRLGGVRLPGSWPAKENILIAEGTDEEQGRVFF